jgi:hypothetical protein
VRCVSAGAERRKGVLCVAPANVVSPQAKKKPKKNRLESARGPSRVLAHKVRRY